MRLEDAFLDTVEDLRRRCDLRASEYDLVQAAGLLRRLLIDEKRLWELVNRRHRVRIECVWTRIGVYNALADGRPVRVPWLCSTRS